MKFNNLNYLGTRWKVGAKIRSQFAALGEPGPDGQIVEIRQSAKFKSFKIKWIKHDQYDYYHSAYILNYYKII